MARTSNTSLPITDFETVARTTRSVRKRLDLQRSVPLDVIEHCMDIALQAPTGGYAQDWRFLVVTEAEKRRQIAHYYHEAYQAEVAAALADESLYAKKVKGRLAEPTESDGKARVARILDGAAHLAANLDRVPVHVIACAARPHPGRGAGGTVSALYGSVYPAVWSFQLALRSQGLGSLITTLHLKYEREIADLLSVPEDVTQVCLLPVAYTLGTDFEPAVRRGVNEVVFHDSWGHGLAASGH